MINPQHIFPNRGILTLCQHKLKMELLNSHPIKKSYLGFHGNLFSCKLLALIYSSAAG